MKPKINASDAAIEAAVSALMSASPALVAENKRLRDALEYAENYFDEANLLRREVIEMVPEAEHIAAAIRAALDDSR